MKTQTHNQKGSALKNSKGFTLVETLVAIFILLLTITTMISLSAGSFYNVRYAQNQLTASALNQEVFEYVRHNRDTAVQKDPVGGFGKWVQSISACITTEFYCDIRQHSENPGNVIALKDSYWSPEKGSFGGVPTSRIPMQLNEFASGVKISSGDYILDDTLGSLPEKKSAFSRGVQFIAYPAVNPTEIEMIVVTTWKNGSVNKQLKESIILTNW
jgi:type II secretory pathway pseudopilin PulG